MNSSQSTIYPRLADAPFKAIIGFCIASGVVSSLTFGQSISDAPRVWHNYRITITDQGGSFIDSVRLTYKAYVNDSLVSMEIRDLEDGIFGLGIPIPKTDSLGNISREYHSKLECSIVRRGYETRFCTLLSDFGSEHASTTGITTFEVILDLERAYSLELYLNRDFPHALLTDSLQKHLLNVIDIVVYQKLFPDWHLVQHQISLDTMNGRSYLNFTFFTLTTYNSLQMTRYDVGREIFESFVKKLLTLLNEELGDSPQMWGFSIATIAHRKPFTQIGESREEIAFDFLLPCTAVQKYKKVRISGQALLDSSIILMDSERINLKLD